MYCAQFLDEDWNAEFLAEVGPLEQAQSGRSVVHSDSEDGFFIQPGTLSEKIAGRKRRSPKSQKDSKKLSRHRARSIKLREKEARLAVMEAALLNEKEQIRKERELLEQQKRLSGASYMIQVDEIEESEDTRSVDSYYSNFDESSDMLRSLGFRVDPDDLTLTPSEAAMSDGSESGSALVDLKKESDEVEATTTEILLKLQNMQKELDSNPFMSLSGDQPAPDLF